MEQMIAAGVRAARWVGLTVASLVVACGGGDPGSTPAQPTVLAQQCAASNPLAPPETRIATLATEKQWLRSHFDEVYLWYDEVPAVDPLAPAYSDTRDVYGSLDRYFDALRSRARTAGGRPKDRFSFTAPADEWNALSRGGLSLGYGIEWALADEFMPLDLRIAYVHPDSPADAAGLRRGDRLMALDGLSMDDFSQELFAALTDALAPVATGSTHRFAFRRTGAGAGTWHTLLTSTRVTTRPVLTHQVLTAVDGAQVGYIVFNDHVATAEAQLMAAVNQLKARQVSDLVLDMRYNGGGFQYIASQLAYMIAGPARTEGRTFQQLQFNAKRVADSADPRARTPFLACSGGAGDCSTGTPLPSLNLPRVYIITTEATCSASEALINGLRGVGVDVRLIGGTTCGKPFGFLPRSNCGITYFAVEFKGLNDRGFGDFDAGFVPGGAGGAGVPGCNATDDLNHALGDRAEHMLRVALDHRVTGRCLQGLSVRPKSAQAALSARAAHGLLLRHPARENLVLRDAH